MASIIIKDKPEVSYTVTAYNEGLAIIRNSDGEVVYKLINAEELALINTYYTRECVEFFTDYQARVNKTCEWWMSHSNQEKELYKLDCILSGYMLYPPKYLYSSPKKERNGNQ